ncbi:hypothetical protein BD289DRAFT_201867 [Coniella lustricola]|uniref:Uncharacterized protein n=1 Tax=Coniella lustricola TaxID=2025994 RepID=A0A2T3ACK1_9PEZI|nr:hypothetical protein BD289DRAFT_201867 [Coniella lustricola]
MATPPSKPTVATQNDFGTVNVVETPTSPSSAFTLSRFEFQSGTTGNEGTKILMVEWDAVAAVGAGKEGNNTVTTAAFEDWDVKWDGKEAVTLPPIRDADTPITSCRVYFLLPPKAPVPALVTISQKSGEVADLHTKPLPAIFPEGLVNEDKGTRGVLHTIWAKQRLEGLEAEIATEMKNNGEGIGLEMALQEKQWIVDHFGLKIDTSSAEAIPLPTQSPSSPVSPRSPMGGRLGEKLKGLKLATSPAGLAAAKEAASRTPGKKVSAVAPGSAPAAFQPLSMATGSAGGIASISAIMQTGHSAPERSGDHEEDLFVLPMSPRSPEMLMSPFSLLKS